MISVLAVTRVGVFTAIGWLHRSTLVTFPCTMSVPNRSACARISAIKSGPMMPSGAPGKFSTMVVNINCPPASIPSMRQRPQVGASRVQCGSQTRRA
jgi:hypothetical protein